MTDVISGHLESMGPAPPLGTHPFTPTPKVCSFQSCGEKHPVCVQHIPSRSGKPTQVTGKDSSKMGKNPIGKKNTNIPQNTKSAFSSVCFMV